MIVHFICRGNTLRSIMAEAYLKSLNINGIQVLSSGTRADYYKIYNVDNFARTVSLLTAHGLGKFVKKHHADQLDQSRLESGDITICMNQLVYDECSSFGNIPTKTFVWSVSDYGEGERIPTSEEEREKYREDMYQEIVVDINKLVRDELSK